MSWFSWRPSKWFRSEFRDEVLEGEYHSNGSLTLTWKVRSVEGRNAWDIVSTQIPPENVQELVRWLNRVSPVRSTAVLRKITD